MAVDAGRRSDLVRDDSERTNLSGFVVPEHLRLSHSPDGAAVLDMVYGKMFRLNLVGSRVLALLKQRITELEIAETLAREFGIDRARAELDVREFIQTLHQHHLLTIRDGNLSA